MIVTKILELGHQGHFRPLVVLMLKLNVAMTHMILTRVVKPELNTLRRHSRGSGFTLKASTWSASAAGSLRTWTTA